jgi:hypothetical protein
MDYKNGKIYKITDLNYTKQYIGSTTQPLYKRLSNHKDKYKYDKYKGSSCKILFDEFGIDNCKIILIEDFPCESKEQLLMRENYYIKNEDCVNKHLSYRTEEDKKECNKNKSKINYALNKNKILEESKKYYENNKDDIKEKCNKYYAINKIKKQLYYNEHKDEINAKRREKRALKKASIKI